MSEKKYFVDINLQGNEVVKLKADTLDITSNAANTNTKRIVYYNGQYYYSNGTNWVSLSGGGGGSVTDVTATAPLSSTGGTSPDISIDQADTTTDGYLSSTDWNTFNSKLGYTGATQDVNLGTYQLTTSQLNIGTTLSVSSSFPKIVTFNNSSSDGDFIFNFNGSSILHLKGERNVNVVNVELNIPNNTGQTGAIQSIIIDPGTKEWLNGSLPSTGRQKEIEILGPIYTEGSGGPPSLWTVPTTTLYINQPDEGFTGVTNAGKSALGLNGNLFIEDGYDLDIGSGTTGAKIGYSSTAKLGFFGVTPVSKPAAVTTVQGLADALFNLGLINSSTIPAGITGNGTTNGIAYFTGSTAVGSLSTATYPSLTELSYVKGVTSAIQTQINNTYIPRIQTVTSAATVTPTSANDEVTITAQAVALTLANPSGTPSEGQAMTIRIKDNGTSQTINYGSQYRALGVALPTNTTVSKTLYLGLIYNSTDTKWDVVGVSLEGSDPYTGSDWVDYSATSTVVGWSSFTTKRIRYRVIGKQIFVSYNLLGTSNSTSANFSLPFPILNNTELATPLVINNGGYATVIADLSGGCFISSNTFGVRWAGSSAGWTASGTKQIAGQFFYEIA